MNLRDKTLAIGRSAFTPETQLNQDRPDPDELGVIGTAQFPPRFSRESGAATR